jgi:hypothetical protein
MSLPRLTCSKDHCDPRRASCIVFCARGVDDRAEAHRIGKHRIGVTSEEGNPSAGGIGRVRHDRAYPVEMESGSPMQAGGSTSSARHCSASAQRGRALADSTKRGKRAAFYGETAELPVDRRVCGCGRGFKAASSARALEPSP